MKNLSVKFKKIYSGFLIAFSIIAVITVCFFMNLWYEFGITLKQLPSLMNTASESQTVLKAAPEKVIIPESAPQEENQIPTDENLLEEATAVYTNPQPSVNETEDENTFIPLCPVSGKEFGEYKGDKLTFSSLFDDWRIYNGVDIYAEENTPVLAVEDGTVAKITNDKFRGISIIVNHQNGYSSVYSNLSTDTIVKEGEEVTREQIISGVGENKYYKDKNGCFLHFELKKDGKDINPSSI